MQRAEEMQAAAKAEAEALAKKEASDARIAAKQAIIDAGGVVPNPTPVVQAEPEPVVEEKAKPKKVAKATPKKTATLTETGHAHGNTQPSRFGTPSGQQRHRRQQPECHRTGAAARHQAQRQGRSLHQRQDHRRHYQGLSGR